MLAWLILLVPTVLTDTCPTCPTGGLWSSWATSDTCNTTCGGCSNVTRTRTCLSTVIGCACNGSTTSTISCNTQACNFPRVDTTTPNCCTGTMMLHNNLYHCGPIEEDLSLSCCPTGGYWSYWSSWSEITDQFGWVRSRECLSYNHACACSGDSIQYTYSCPCQTATQLPTTSTACSSLVPSGYVPVDETNFRPAFITRLSLCTAYSHIEASNFHGTMLTQGTSTVNSYVGYIQPNGTCYVSIVNPATTITVSGALYRMVYTCNLDTGYYENSDGVSFVQLAQFKSG